MAAARYLPGSRFLPTRAPFTQIVDDDPYLFLAGVVAADLPEGAAALGDIEAETKVVMTALRDELADLGVAMEQVVRVDVHLTDLDEMDRMNAVYGTYFPNRAFPARTCVEVGRLFGDSRIEVTCIAKRP